MSIKIVPQEQLDEQKEKNSIIPHIPLLFYPTLKILYANRIKRMESLAKESPFADYLNFCIKIVSTQAELSEKYSPKTALNSVVYQAAEKSIAPLSLENYPINDEWCEYLRAITAATRQISPEIDKTIAQLNRNGKEELLTKAIKLRHNQFDQVDNNESLFIWSALSLYYSQLASHLPGKAVAELGEQRWLCPVCQSSPIASIIHVGSQAGLRYLHCSLCESEWYVPRVKCTNCDNLENINYYALDQELAAIKTECCEHCHSYLKIFNQDRDPYLDIIADDINSLMLDLETEKLGFAKSGINPLLFSNGNNDKS